MDIFYVDSASFGELQITGSITLSGSFINDSFVFISGGLVVGEELGGYVQAGNHKMQIIASGSQTPLVVEGGTGAVEIWQDTSPSNAVAFGMGVPGGTITEDFVFSGYNGAWNETMRIVTAYKSLQRGVGSTASGPYSHAEGSNASTGIYADNSHAEGKSAIVNSAFSHAEGSTTNAGALGYASDPAGLVSGSLTLDAGYGDVSAEFSTEGVIILSDDLGGTFYYTLDLITIPFFNGTNTIVTIADNTVNATTFVVGVAGVPVPTLADNTIGAASHAEGGGTQTYGQNSHAAGYGTVAVADFQNTVGTFNLYTNNASFVIGNGTYDNARSNLLVASGSMVQITGSLEVTQGITGSLRGTASYALSSSYALTASYVNTLNQNVYITGDVTASIFASTNNSNGTNFKVGDDTWLGDINTANTLGIKGQQDATKGYIKFGSGSLNPILGSGGTSTLELTGSLSLASGSITLTTGSITMPNRPAFRVTGAGGAKVATTALSGSYLNVDYQQGSGWDNSTGTFTAPIAGLYQVNVVVRTNSNSLGTISQLIVYKNNTGGTTGTPQIMIEFGANTTMNHAGGSTISKLAVGDTLKMVVASGEISFDLNNNFSVAYIG